MRTLLLLTFVIPLQVFAGAPECPGYSNKNHCLNAVEDNYEQFLDFIKDETDDQDKMIQAANDIKHFESLACQKTCWK